MLKLISVIACSIAISKLIIAIVIIDYYIFATCYLTDIAIITIIIHFHYAAQNGSKARVYAGLRGKIRKSEQGKTPISTEVIE